MLMNSKFHKSRELNGIIENRNSEYFNINEYIQIQDWWILAGPVSYTCRISNVLLIIFELSILSFLTF